MSWTLRERLRGSPFQAYTYAYPHKTAYQALDPVIPLKDAWKHERKSSVFLYMHVPFCEMRCGFCNLFTEAHSRSGLNDAMQSGYVEAVERQAKVVHAALGEFTISRMAIGGGTPTFLAASQLERLLQIALEMTSGSGDISISVESSPYTATPDRLNVLRSAGVSRLSIGVQSFIASEAQASGRAQTGDEVQSALRNIRNADFPCLNIDLIYGLPGQTVSSWMESLQAALEWGPEELYLYPLYVRPLTGLGRRNSDALLEYTEDIPICDQADNLKLECLRAAIDFLTGNNYSMLSMRHFRKVNSPQLGTASYTCQEDGMLGLGCGSRSYTRALHYSSEYAVSGTGVREIIGTFLKASPENFSIADYGFWLDENEQRRRYLIKSMLRSDGLDTRAYHTFFGTHAFSDFPELTALIERKLATLNGDQLTPTRQGLEASDVIGPWLASQKVKEQMQKFKLR